MITGFAGQRQQRPVIPLHPQLVMQLFEATVPEFGQFIHALASTAEMQPAAKRPRIPRPATVRFLKRAAQPGGNRIGISVGVIGRIEFGEALPFKTACVQNMAGRLEMTALAAARAGQTRRFEAMVKLGVEFKKEAEPVVRRLRSSMRCIHGVNSIGHIR